MSESATQAAAPPQAAGGAAILARLRAQRAGAAPPATTAAAAAAAAAPAAAPAPAEAAATAVPAAPAGPAPATGGAAILARLRAQRAAAAAAPKAPPAKELVVLYASQTGTASEIAKNIQAEAEQKGIKGRVASMNEFGFDSLAAAKASVVIYVAASTGDGDAPDNAAKFYATLRRKSQPAGLLAGVTFTGFGLGDSNYTRYQHVPRAVRQRLQDLGATAFYPPGEADEVDGIEEGLDKWLEGLWPALRKAVQPEAAATAEPPAAAPAAEGSAAPAELTGVPPLPRCRVRLDWLKERRLVCAAARYAEGLAPMPDELAYRDPEGRYSAEQPFWAPVSGARYLTSELSSADRQVLHLELDLAGSGMRYAPGDSIGVLPQNDASLVERLLERLGLDGNAVFDVRHADDGGGGGGERMLPHLRAPCSVRAALRCGVDLTGPPRKSLLRLLAEHCSDGGERQRLLRLTAREGRDDYAASILGGRPSLLQLLQEHPSCKPPLGALLDALPPLAARMYSLSSSPLECGDKAHVAFTVVRYNTERYGDHEGVATTWLHRLCGGLAAGHASDAGPPRLPVFLRRGGAFAPPASLATPLVMIGPGTGVTPFRGFLQHRRAQLKEAAAAAAASGGEPAPCGAAWLYFGCRHQDQDYLYREDLEAFLADGTLDALHAAFSRAQPHKVYVQHLMAAHAPQLHDLIANQGAHVYVCGDGAAMAKDVHACLQSILQQQGGLAEAEAAEKLSAMTREGRYVRDIWS